MIDSKTIEQLREVGKKVKDLFPGINGNVQINLSRDPRMEPKVTIVVADATEVKK